MSNRLGRSSLLVAILLVLSLFKPLIGFATAGDGEFTIETVSDSEGSPTKLLRITNTSDGDVSVLGGYVNKNSDDCKLGLNQWDFEGYGRSGIRYSRGTYVFLDAIKYIMESKDIEALRKSRPEFKIYSTQNPESVNLKIGDSVYFYNQGPLGPCQNFIFLSIVTDRGVVEFRLDGY